MTLPHAQRCIARNIGDLSAAWSRVAVQTAPGEPWVWDFDDYDTARMMMARDMGRVVTMQERRDDGVFWLLAKLVKKPITRPVLVFAVEGLGRG